jgi:alpha-L-fucosidase
MTTNDNWGYFEKDKNFKTPREIISIFTDCIGYGGNLLLDIGPRADGSIPGEQVRILRELGRWTNRHSEAIFGTEAGLPEGHFYGPSTLSKDSTTVFLFLPAKQHGEIVLKGLMNKISSVEVVGKGRPLKHKIVGKISWSPVPGLVFIRVPAGAHDRYMTVLKVKLDSPLKLYRGKGGLSS